MHGARCVWVHFPAHQAVRSDPLTGFLQSLTKASSKLVERGSSLQLTQKMCSRLLQMASSETNTFPFPTGLDGPTLWRSHTSAKWRHGKHRTIWFQAIPPIWLGTRGCERPLVHPEVGTKHDPNAEPCPSLFSSFINHRLLLHGSICVGLCSFLSFPRTPRCGGLGQDWSWSFAPDLMNTILPPMKTVWCHMDAKALLFTF